MRGPRVVDDGVSFLGPPPEGRGLVQPRERAAALGGRLSLSSSPGRGTTVHVRFEGAPAP